MAAFGIVLLAAGASERLGSPKQNLLFRGQTLLQHAVQVALESGCAPIVVVLGAQANAFKMQLDFPEITVAENPAWEEGMGASIRFGVDALLQEAPSISGVIVMLCDQPFVSGELLRRLILEKQSNQKPIIACAYQDTLGTPALFDKNFFPELLTLEGAHGAKKLLFQYPAEVGSVPFELGSFDIDTLSDYTSLQDYLEGKTDRLEET